ncbi:winged helix-turn-helix transcriptional regulator [Microbacterium sp. MMO-56]
MHAYRAVQVTFGRSHEAVGAVARGRAGSGRWRGVRIPRAVVPRERGRRDPARDVLARISDRWTLAVMRVLQLQGPLHFGRLERQLPGVSRKMLTQTLRSIERDGMVSRTVHPGRVTHVEYALTALGRGALEPIDVLCAWSRDNMAVVESARARYDAAAHLDG